ncbi:MAG: hypothetical protein WDO13_20220 [Verrucomicrobiota bacterium]
MLHPPAGAWIFIDWGQTSDRQRVDSALQILWYWAQRSAATLAAKAGDTAMAQRWGDRADALAAQLQKRGWDDSAQAWRQYLDNGDATSPYPNFLAVLASLAQPAQQDGIRRALLAHPCTGTPFMRGFALLALARLGAPEEATNATSPYPNFLAVLASLAQPAQQDGIRRALLAHPCTGTPFMRGFALLALARLGAPEEATKQVRTYWGAMLERGATTFWENFQPGEKDDHAMYGRPFGRSLCHAWASSPVAILPEAILGVRPLRDGWKDIHGRAASR